MVVNVYNPQSIDLVYYRGTVFHPEITFVDSNDQPIDLTGKDYSMVIAVVDGPDFRTYSTESVEYPITVTSLGVMTIGSDDDLIDWGNNIYRYAILANVGAETSIYLVGKIIIRDAP